MSGHSDCVHIVSVVKVIVYIIAVNMYLGNVHMVTGNMCIVIGLCTPGNVYICPWITSTPSDSDFVHENCMPFYTRNMYMLCISLHAYHRPYRRHRLVGGQHRHQNMYIYSQSTVKYISQYTERPHSDL